MKEVKAFIRPNRVHKVVEALNEEGFKNITFTKGEGTGVYKDEDASPSLDFSFTDSPIVKLELVCQNDEAQKVINIICVNGRSPQKGDGIVFLSNIEDAYKVKSGESIKQIRKDADGGYEN